MVQTFFEVAELQLIYKSKVKPSLRPKITKSADAFEVLKKHWNSDRLEFVEEFKVMLLNRANRILGIIHLLKLNLKGCLIRDKVTLPK